MPGTRNTLATFGCSKTYENDSMGILAIDCSHARLRGGLHDLGSQTGLLLPQIAAEHPIRPASTPTR